jgi:hypothetical protein
MAGTKEVKGHTHYNQSEEECLGAIYHFFKDLVDGKMQLKGQGKDKIIPFGVYISTIRR